MCLTHYSERRSERRILQ